MHYACLYVDIRKTQNSVFVDSENIGPDFKLDLEVYAHLLRDDLSIASSPTKIKNTLHNSISTFGKKLATTLKHEQNDGKM